MKSMLSLVAALATATLVTSCTPPSNFDIADRDGDGRLSKEETEKALLSAIFANGDPNGDGKLSFDELSQADPDYPRSRFDARDLDGDGFVTPNELDRFAAENDSFDALITSIDEDGDGYVNRAEADVFNERLAAAQGDNPLQKLINLNASISRK